MTELGIDAPTTTGGRTSLHRIHRASGPLGEALASLPDWSDAMRRWEILISLRPPVATGATEAVVADAVESALKDPAPDVDYILRAATDAAAREQAASLVHVALERVRESVREELDNAVHGNAGRLFKHLTGQLAVMVDEAAGLYDRLGAVTNAAEAIDADRVEEWKLVPGLAARHSALRLAQVNLWLRVGPEIWPRENPLGFMRSPHEADPDYLARRAGAQIDTESGPRPPHPAPWPEDLKSDDGLRFLALHREAEPWIPSPKEFTDRESELRALSMPSRGPASPGSATSRRMRQLR